MDPKGGKPAHSYGLDIVRFAAALLATSWHLGYRFFDKSASQINRFADLPPSEPLIPQISAYGWIGVQIFFVISGVVISNSALRSDAYRFFSSRAKRLYPVILVAVAIIGMIDILFWQMSLLETAKASAKMLFFWPFNGWLAPQFWTLPVEVAFYTLVLSLIATGRVAQIEWLAFALLAVSALYWMVTSSTGEHTKVDLARVILLQHGMYFAMGVVISKIPTAGFTLPRIAALAVGCALAAPEIRWAMSHYGVIRPHALAWTIPYAVWLMGTALLLGSLLAQRSIAGLVERYNLGTLIRTFGLATYPLYLLHIHVGGLVATLLARQGLSAAASVFLGGVVCIAVAIVVAKAVEPPVARFIGGVLSFIRAMVLRATGSAIPGRAAGD